MPGGYAGKFLDVDLTRGKIKDTIFGDETLEMFFGGRGLASRLAFTVVHVRTFYFAASKYATSASRTSESPGPATTTVRTPSCRAASATR